MPMMPAALRLLALMFGAALSLNAAFLLRFEFTIPMPERRLLGLGLCLFLPAKGIVFLLFRIPQSPFRTIGLFDLLRITCSNVCASGLAYVVTFLFLGPSFPRSIYVTDLALCLLAVSGLLISVRLYREVLLTKTVRSRPLKSVLIYGAGMAGLTLAREIRSNPRLGARVAGFLDDDFRKRSASVAGVPVLGTGRDAAPVVARLRRRKKQAPEIVIAMPSATAAEMRSAIENCRAAGVPFRTVPSLSELLEGKVLSRQIREVSVDDLLGREPVSIDETIMLETIAGKTVMVTGGCGSIGSELCRQLPRFRPGKLVIYDRAESEMFMLALELRSHFPALNIVTEIGDICRMTRVEEVLARHAVFAVFHAAAYKHVPLMEAHVPEAAENNVLGTYNVAQAAHRHGVSKFVMISTDKAVNPTSIMGATKRAAELVVSAMPLDGKPSATTFVSVRFGNVLASAGSVVRVFQWQIATGGPVTVTDPEMRRYFMSVPEAVQLVLQASAMGKGSEVFVLDMGPPVSILELAQNMIRFAGLVPHEDIDIRFTGLRPGEKLFEELRLDSEAIAPTHHEKIKIFRSGEPARQHILHWLEGLRVIIDARDAEAVRSHLVALVPEFCAGGTNGARAVPSKPPAMEHAHAASPTNGAARIPPRGPSGEGALASYPNDFDL